MARVALERWQAELFRVTFFYGADRPMPENVWDVLVAAAPESRIQAPATQTLTEQAAFAAGRLVCVTAPGRVDVVYHGVPSVGFASLGPVDSAKSTIYDLILSHADLFTSASRVALGAIAIIPVPRREDGYQLLGEMLPGVVVDDRSRDFFYQINRPRQSLSIPDVELNRLSKWGTMQSTSFSIGMPLLARQPLWAFRTEIDLSTPVELGLELSAQSLRDLFVEFATLGFELLEEGDVE